jgi:hypothetical protein
MVWNSVSYRPLNMTTTFATKSLKHAPVIGRMAKWQPVLRSSYATEGGRCSRLLGIVGLKF